MSLGVALEYIDIDLDGFNEVDEYDDFAVTEQMYQRILKSLQSLYFDGTVPELVRCQTLEALQSKISAIKYEAVRVAGNWGIADA